MAQQRRISPAVHHVLVVSLMGEAWAEMQDDGAGNERKRDQGTAAAPSDGVVVCVGDMLVVVGNGGDGVGPGASVENVELVVARVRVGDGVNQDLVFLAPL